MQTIWITGARGFIGRHLAKRLASEGNTVVGIGHGAWTTSAAASFGVTHWVNGDITGNNLHGLHSTCGLPAVVYHLAGGASVGAALVNPNEDFSRTVGSTVSLLEWLRLVSPSTSLVAVSSAAVYGAGHAGPIAEEASCMLDIRIAAAAADAARCYSCFFAASSVSFSRAPFSMFVIA